MATNQVSAQARGVVVVLQGKAWVVNAAGQRVAQVGGASIRVTLDEQDVSVWYRNLSS